MHKSRMNNWVMVVAHSGYEHRSWTGDCVQALILPLKGKRNIMERGNKEGESIQDLEMVTTESREVGNIWVKALGLNVIWRFIFQKTVGSRWRQILSCGKCSALRWGQVISSDLDMRSSTLLMALLSRNIKQIHVLNYRWVPVVLGRGTVRATILKVHFVAHTILAQGHALPHRLPFVLEIQNQIQLHFNVIETWRVCSYWHQTVLQRAWAVGGLGKKKDKLTCQILPLEQHACNKCSYKVSLPRNAKNLFLSFFSSLISSSGVIHEWEESCCGWRILFNVKEIYS